MHPFSRRLVDRAPRGLRGPLALVVHTVDRSMANRLPGLAAEIAFWVLLSLPALVLATIAAAGALIGDREEWRAELINRVTEISRVALTPQTIEQVVRPVLVGTFEGGGIGLVSFAFLATVWTASRAVRVVLTTIAVTAGAEGVRPGWKDRLLGFGLTFGALLSGIVIAPLLLAGPAFGEQLAEILGPDANVLAPLWRVLYWPATTVLAMLGLALLYHVGVPGHSSWRQALPGALLATIVWVLGSGGLRLYGAWVLDDESAYGPLAGPIVALLWVWVTGLAVLVGAVFNAELSQRHERRANAASGERDGDHGAARPAAAAPIDLAPDDGRVERPDVDPQVARPATDAEGARPHDGDREAPGLGDHRDPTRPREQHEPVRPAEQLEAAGSEGRREQARPEGDDRSGTTGPG